MTLTPGPIPRLSNRTATRTFRDEHKLIGVRLVELLAAAKRNGLHKAPNTIAGLQDAVKSLARAIKAHAPHELDVSSWQAAHVAYLRSLRVSERTRRSTFAKATPILAEVARSRRLGFTPSVNPFASDRVGDAPYVVQAILDGILKTAKADAVAIYNRFLSPPAQYLLYLDEARGIAAKNNGLLPRYQHPNPRLRTPLETQTLSFVNRARSDGIDMGLLRTLVCPQAVDLVPFFLLMMYALAANVESLANLRCDAIRKYDNPLTGARLLITLDKPRAGGEIPPYQVAANGGTLTVSWLIDAVAHMTAFTRTHAPKGKAATLLFMFTGNGTLLSFTSQLRFGALKRYLARRGHPHIAFNALRPTRLINDFRKHKDVDRARVLARQKSVATTLLYLDHSLAREEDEALIARAQGDVYAPPEAPTTGSVPPVAWRRGTPATLPTHTCANPEDPNLPHDSDGKCLNFMWPLNDRHFIMLLEPRPVAFLLRDYDALCEAQLRLPAARFEKSYGPKKRYIEDHYLPMLDDEIVGAAREVIPSLPRAPLLA